MKNLIIILLLIPFALNGQNWKIDLAQQDKQAHIAAGYFIALVGNIETYNIIKDTNLKPWQSKAISFVSGAALGILAGHAKETWDKKRGRIYSRKDFNCTLLGAIGGSITVRVFLWNSLPESHIPVEELWLLNEPLVKK